MKMNKKIKSTFYLLSVLAVLFMLFFCKKKESPVYVHKVNTADSTMLDLSSYSVKKIHVGDKISNVPLASQIVKMGDKDKYVLLDDSKLYIFDYEEGELEDSISLEKCGKLSVYSGFTYVNEDTILVYNYSDNLLFGINKSGGVFSTWKIPQNEDKIEWVHSINALNISKIGFYDSLVIISGGILGSIRESRIKNIPVSESLNIKTGKWVKRLSYPAEYSTNNYGTIYLNRIYASMGRDKHYIYGFPIDTKVLSFSSDFKRCDTLCIQSRYDKGRKPCTIHQNEVEDDDTNEIQYYVSQLSYSDLIYDSYRDYIIRVVNHPLKNWTYNKPFTQPRSFIIADSKGSILSESCILTDVINLNFGNMHICSDGLIIAECTKNENDITFRCYNIRNR